MSHDKENRRGPRILVVEDNARVLQMYAHALGRLGGADGPRVEVEYAANGHDGLERVRRPPVVDLVVSDLYMPVLDGFAMIERMRGEPSLATIPIVVISAGAAEARARALELGVDAYLQKPVQFSDVVHTVRTLLRPRA